ncbi:MAG: aminotransferase class I/II-fold pyridoxal phosphate-dependent enzyme [Oscillochloridaceae bacterium umkhey_bin13]
MKTQLADIALFGGPSLFAQQLHVGRPNIGDRERLLTRINTLLDRRWLTNSGPFVQELEQRIAQMLGVRHCIAMSNGTVALEIAIRASGLAGEVLVPGFTFIATAHALQWQGITPIFCDVNPQTHLIDPVEVERRISPRTTGIIGVHLWGQACEVEALAEIAHRHQLKLLYDAAHAFGCSYQGQMIGNFGDAEVFSFHATKVFNTFEGGAVVTNDDELADRIRLMRNFGFADYDMVEYIGTNGKMSEVSAAMGLTSLESLDEFITVNYQNYRQYQRELANVPGLTVLNYREFDRLNYQYVVLAVETNEAHLSRDDLIAILWAEQILARRYFFPGCHRMEPYRSLVPPKQRLLPHTEDLAQRVFCLPTGTTVTPATISTICQLIRFVVEHGSAIRARLLDTNPAISKSVGAS